MNTVYPLRSEISDEEIPLQLSYVLLRGLFEIFLPSVHGATCVYFGVVTHVRGGEGLYRMVEDPIMDLVVTCRDEASILAVKGVADVKFCATSITMFN